MATSGGIPGGGGDKGEVRTETQQPMDLAGHGHVPHPLHAHHAHTIVRTGVPGQGGTSVVQLRPIRTFTTGPTGALVGAKAASVGVTTVTAGQPSMFVNRSGPNLTIVPARATGGQIGVGPMGTGTAGPNSSISTLQFARGTILSNVRPGTSAQGPSGSITVTPISASSFGTSIRLSTGTPPNNGTWIHAPGGATTFTPLRPTTIQLTNRGIRPDGSKLIHIPQQGSLQPLTALTQLQVVDNKGSILKPMVSATPIIVRGALHPTSVGGFNNPSYSLRAATPTQRPATSIAASTASTSQGQKVITQPAHGPPIIVNANVNSKLPPHTIQTITSMPRLPVFTLSTNATTLTPNSPIVGMSPRHGGGANLIMTSGMNSGTTSGSPMIKAYPISRDVSSSIVETFINQGHVHTSQHQINSPTLTVTVSGSNNPNTLVTSHGSHVIHQGSVITSTSANAMLQGNSGLQTQSYGLKAVSISQQQQHQLVQVHGAINVNSSTGAVSLPVQSMHGNLTPYYIEQKNMNVSILPSQGPAGQAQVRPLAMDKRTMSGSDGKSSLVTGPMIITNPSQQQYTSSSNTLQGSVSIPIGPHSFAHPISMSSQQSTLVNVSQAHAPHLIAASQGQAITLSKSTNSPMTHAFSTHGQPVTHNIGGHLITVTPHLSIPAQVIPSRSGNTTSGTLTATTTSSLTSSVTTTGTVSVNSSAGASAVSMANSSAPSSSATTSSCVNTSVGGGSCTTTTPAQSPSQSTKATLSPRPSILRKREAAAASAGGLGSDIYTVPFRAQRNLAINFTGNSSSTTLSGLPTIGISIGGTSISSGTPSVTISTVVSTAANKENSMTATTTGPLTMTSVGHMIGNVSQPTSLQVPSSGSGGGLSILKKEFQPPNEESSWQSCSSNSSSGSTTLSTTSETAEIQLQQSSNDLGNMSLSGLHSLNNSLNSLTSMPSMSHHNSSNVTTSMTGTGGMSQGHSNLSVNSLNRHNNSLPTMISINSTHNGMFQMVRTNPPNPPATSAPPIRHRTTSANKGGNALERGKGRGKDIVSPRKKPRKQQLTISDFIESASPEISFYQGKRFKRSEPPDPAVVSGVRIDKAPDGLVPIPEREPPPPSVVYHLNKPYISLIESNKLTLTKVRANHFIRYDDVKAKDEKRPTINDLANQKNVVQKIGGWKLQHLSNQMNEVILNEMNSVDTFHVLLSELDARTSSTKRDLSRIEDLLKGNIQRCRVIKDQLSDSKNQVIKVLEHQPRILDVINKYISKRPIKKRERL